MEMPEHVRRLKMELAHQQAMDAVSHKETTNYIRSFANNGVEARHDFSPVKMETEPPGPLTDEIKHQAMESLTHPETTAQIKLMADLGGGPPAATPSAHSRIIAERIAEMHETGQSIGAIQQTLTKDNFGREHEIG